MKTRVGCIILVLSFILCGCSATYDVEITDNKVIEDFTFIEDASKKNDRNLSTSNIEGTEYSQGGEVYEKLVNDELKIETQAFVNEGEKYYKKTLIDSDKYGINYKYSFNLNDYRKSYIANSATNKFNSLYSNGILYISTSTEVAKEYFENFKALDDITIHIKSSYKAKKNNADKVDGYNYYWYINRANYKDKNIYIELDKDDEIFNYEGRVTIYLIVGLCIAIFAFVVIIFLSKKRKKINKI